MPDIILNYNNSTEYATAALLRAVDTTNYTDTETAYVTAVGLFYFSPSGSGTDDGATVIIPTTGKGAWLIYPGNYIHLNSSNKIDDAQLGITGTALTYGSAWIGDSSGVAAEIDLKGSGKILVGNGTTATSVAVSGDATLSAAGALTVADSVLDGSNVSNVADANVIGGIPVVHTINTAGGATANTDVTLTHKTRFCYFIVQNNGTGTTSDTITITDGTNAITDAIDISGADKTVALVSTIDDAYATISAGGTLRVTETDGGGSDSPAVTVTAIGVRSA